MAVAIPSFRLSSILADEKPTSDGPSIQPKSPARARKANIAVPPPLRIDADILKVPGHIIPTDKPQSAQPKNPKNAFCEKPIIQYETQHKTELKTINFFRLILCPNLP